MPGQCLLILAVHHGVHSDGAFSHWDTMDKLYNELESLLALQINVLFLGLDSLGESKKDAVVQIADHLPLLRARRDFYLTFLVEGEIVPWETQTIRFSDNRRGSW